MITRVEAGSGLGLEMIRHHRAPEMKARENCRGPGNIRRQSEIKFTDAGRTQRPAPLSPPFSDRQGPAAQLVWRMRGERESAARSQSRRGYEKVFLMHLKHGDTAGTAMSGLSCGRLPYRLGLEWFACCGIWGVYVEHM